jgi:N,N-dimethylformamidase beta subunit-like, C-terminal
MFAIGLTSKGSGDKRALLVPALAAVLAALALPTTTATNPSPRPQTVEVEEDEGLAPRPKWENTPGVAATFRRESYAPGSTAKLVLWRREAALELQLFRVGPEHTRTVGNVTMNGVPMGPAVKLRPHAAHRPIGVAIGDWPTGLYFARLEASDGRVGFAPFVVRPHYVGEHRVLVVLPTFTWQAYNFRDDDGNGYGDTWYAGWKQEWARLHRPYLSRGVPPHFRQYDLPFLHWLALRGHDVDVFADEDLADGPSARRLARAYDLIVFPGHHEYVTGREYDVVTRYRDLGGHLMFLSADNFFWKVVRRGDVMWRTAQWRDLGRPESALVGVQYVGTDGGRNRAGWTVRGAQTAPWLFAGSGLRNGDGFGNGGIEVDHTSAASPRGIKVLAEIPHLFGPRFTAQMTYYETARGGRVFAAGAFTLGGSAVEPEIDRLLTRLWARLAARQ